MIVTRMALLQVTDGDDRLPMKTAQSLALTAVVCAV